MNDYIVLNNNEIPFIRDNGMSWYPLTYFFKKGLNREYKAKDFVETRIEQNMKVVNYKFPKSYSYSKTWFINEIGIKKILKNIQTKFGPNEKLNYERELLVDEACILFNINRKDKKIIYAKIDYRNLTGYDSWIMTCFEYDTNLSNTTIWKWCDTCNKYYPNNENYFGNHKSSKKNIILHSTCKLCEHKKILCDNNDLNIIHKHNNYKLLNMYKRKEFYDIFKYMAINNYGYNLSIFNNYLKMVDMIVDIKNEKDFDLENYYIAYFSRIFNISLSKLKEYLDIGNIKIGIKSPLPEDKKKSLKKITQEELFTLCNKNFKLIIKKDKIKFIDEDAIIGIITKKGLNIISKNQKNISGSRINYYKFSGYKKDAEKIIKIIRRQGGTK